MSIKLPKMPIIDSHVHLWDVGRLHYPWLDEEPFIRKNFLMEDYQQQTANFTVEKMVFIQCDCHSEQYLEELKFVAEQALIDTRLKAIVAYAPLEKGQEIAGVLEAFQANPLIKGVRKMYDDLPEICTSSDFLDAVRMLPAHNLSFDVSIKPRSINETIRMMQACPETQFVLDHLAKPDIKNGSLTKFKKNINSFALLPNVSAKISGLITEADRSSWTKEDIRPYVDYAIESFGFDRLMFGGDWPVVLLAGSYNQWLYTLFQCVESCSDDELNKLFYKTANRIYCL